MVRLPTLRGTTAPTAPQQYDDRSDGLYLAARGGVGAAVGARIMVDPVGRAHHRNSNSALAGNPWNRFIKEAVRDSQ